MFVFNSKLDFYEWIAKRFPTFDLNASLWVTGFGYQLKDQAPKVLPNLEWLLDAMNRDMDSGFDKSLSRMLGGHYHIYMQDSVIEEPVIEKPLEPEVEEPLEPEVEEPLEPEVEKPEVVTEDTVDLEHAKKLSTKAELETYAKSFGITLKKNKTIANMLKDLEQAAKH